MVRQQIARLSYINEMQTFVPDFDKAENYNLREFLSDFPNAYYRSGVWNEYKLILMREAFERVQRSPYGADVYIEWDEAWELGKSESTLNVYFSCPCSSDMW